MKHSNKIGIKPPITLNSRRGIIGINKGMTKERKVRFPAVGLTDEEEKYFSKLNKGGIEA